jgi:hypothetical protein
MSNDKGVRAEKLERDRHLEPEQHHDDVVSNLLDLQARLRASGASMSHAATVVAEPPHGASGESAGLLILHDGGGVPSLASAAADTEARLASLMERLDALESGMDGVVERVEAGNDDRLAVVDAFAAELAGFRKELMHTVDERLDELERQVIRHLGDA